MTSRGLLNQSMATRNAANLPERKQHCTEFQLHGEGNQKGVIDFTEQKLVRFAARIVDAQQKLVVLAMLDDYRDGNIAVAWRRGQPCWLRVTHES